MVASPSSQAVQPSEVVPSSMVVVPSFVAGPSFMAVPSSEAGPSFKATDPSSKAIPSFMVIDPSSTATVPSSTAASSMVAVPSSMVVRPQPHQFHRSLHHQDAVQVQLNSSQVPPALEPWLATAHRSSMDHWGRSGRTAK